MTDISTWRLPAAVAVTALVLTACAPEDAAEFEDGQPAEAEEPAQNTQSEPSDPAEDSPQPSPNGSDEGSPQPEPNGTDTPDEEVLVAEVDEPVEFDECTDAEESDDATVTWLDDVVFEEEELAPEVPAETVEVNGDQVELPGAPAVVLPERVGQAGCIIEYDAPGGCLPALEISAAHIPGYTLPGRALPAVELPDGTELHELVQNEISVAPIDISGVTAAEVCQDEEGADEGDMVWGVTRWGETRWGETQWGETVWSETRWGESIDDGGRTPSMTLDTFSSDTLRMDTVRVETETLDTYRLEGSEHTEYSEENEVTSYTTEGDVLFDSDEYELRSDAEPELQVIADDIAERSDDYVIEVEGHTDDLPTSVYDDNYELSELRAESVVQWLIDHAEVEEDAIAAEGLGEDYPRADNSSDEGRQQNRRVVITVAPADGADAAEVDYDLEDLED